MFVDQCRHHGANLTEHTSPLLYEQLVAGQRVAVGDAVEETGIVTNGVGKTCYQTRAKDLETRFGSRQASTFEHHSSTGIAKNKVAITIPEVEVRRADLRIDHQRSSNTTATNGVGGQVDGKGC